MIWLSYFLFWFLIVRLLVSLANMLSVHHLPNKTKSTPTRSTSVLIPARNEEDNIGKLLGQFDYSSPYLKEVIVYNDNSTDSTASIVAGHANSNNKIHLMNGEVLPQGWLGKNHACHHLAERAQGDYLLFLDADVGIEKNAIAKAISHLEIHDLHLLSMFPKQVFSSIGERVTVPIMNWILLSLLPMRLIRSTSIPAFSAANGQFMMFRADTYNKHLPHHKFRDQMVEDIAIIRYFKSQKLKSDTLLGRGDVTCQMYSGASEAIGGFSKNIFEFFGGSALVTVLVACLTSIAPFIIYWHLGMQSAVIYACGIVCVRVCVSIASHQSVWQNVLLIFPQHLAFLGIIVRRLSNNRKKEIIWKERNVF